MLDVRLVSVSYKMPLPRTDAAPLLGKYLTTSDGVITGITLEMEMVKRS